MAAILRRPEEELTAIEKMERMRNDNRPLPMPDLTAETLKDAYPLSSLVESMKTTFASLRVQPWQQSVEKNTPVSLSHRFPASRLVRVVNEKDVQQIKTLQYLLILLQFHSSLKKPKGIRDNATLPSKGMEYKLIPASPTPAIVNAIRRRFCPEGRVLPSEKLILLRTTILALTLHVDNFTTDIRDIIKDLDIDVPTIQKYYRELGCQPHKPTEKEWGRYNVQTKAQASQLKIFKLKLPLGFPKARMKGVSGSRGRGRY
jgi:DNA-directed RNA polymerase I subunit RPA49